MSQMLNLIKSVKLDQKTIIRIVDHYENDLQDYESNLTMKGKTLEFCLKEQASWTAYYSERKNEIKSIVAFFEGQVKKVRAQLYVQYNENHTRALGDRTIEKYIDREEEYLIMNSYLLEFEEILGKYEMLLDAFNKRGFALRDLTASRIAAVNESVL